ncbi:MAG TPA: hypothetical protein VE684_19425, partial [Crenalkalicoccus sp.]|nr:hypothetical protein [Crenalkalicoccus sp.]
MLEIEKLRRELDDQAARLSRESKMQTREIILYMSMVFGIAILALLMGAALLAAEVMLAKFLLPPRAHVGERLSASTISQAASGRGAGLAGPDHDLGA